MIVVVVEWHIKLSTMELLFQWHVGSLRLSKECYYHHLKWQTITWNGKK